MGRFLYGLEHTGQDFQTEILLIASPIRPSLHHPDLIVEILHEAKRDLVLGLAVCGKPVPMPLDHRRKFLIGLEALPLQRGLPVLEKSPSPAFGLILP